MALPRLADRDNRSARRALDQLAGLVTRARRVTDVPLLAGFGIATPEQAARAAGLADGIVVGSRAVEVADDGGPEALRAYVESLRRAVDASPAPAAAP